MLCGGLLVALEDGLGNVGDMLAGVGLSSNVELCAAVRTTLLKHSRQEKTHIIMLILREETEPLLEENGELVRHFIKLRYVAIGVDVAETGSDGVVDEQQVRKLMPRAVVVLEVVLVL